MDSRVWAAGWGQAWHYFQGAQGWAHMRARGAVSASKSIVYSGVGTGACVVVLGQWMQGNYLNRDLKSVVGVLCRRCHGWLQGGQWQRSAFGLRVGQRQTLSVWAAGWAGKRSRFGLQGGQYSGQQLRQRAALGFFFRTDGQRQTLGVWAAGWAAANARDLGCRVRCGAGTSVGVGTEAEALESGVGREGRAMALEWGEKEFGQERGTGLGMNLLCNLSLI